MTILLPHVTWSERLRDDLVFDFSNVVWCTYRLTLKDYDSCHEIYAGLKTRGASLNSVRKHEHKAISRGRNWLLNAIYLVNNALIVCLFTGAFHIRLYVAPQFWLCCYAKCSLGVSGTSLNTRLFFSGGWECGRGKRGPHPPQVIQWRARSSWNKISAASIGVWYLSI